MIRVQTEPRKNYAGLVTFLIRSFKCDIFHLDIFFRTHAVMAINVIIHTIDRISKQIIFVDIIYVANVSTVIDAGLN